MISKKNIQFLHSPSPFFLSVRMTPNWAGPPTSGRRNLSYQPPPPLSPLVFLQKIGMQKENQNAVYSLVSSRTRHLSVWNTYIRTRHLSRTLIAEPDPSLEHLYQNQTPVWNTFWTLLTLILIIALDIQFLWIPFHSPPL